jgi:uracil-DNA glycosylase family protein
MAKPARTAQEFIPVNPTLDVLRKRAKGCTACDLYKCGTQTVFGEGAAHAQVVLVGEQPGDKEDLQGKPFVGPAGRILDAALEAAGIDRAQTYVTNIVKHFKWEPRGKRRIHKKPNAMEIAACRPWFDAEVKVLKPQIVVLLGATAAQALLGRAFRVTKSRGQIIPASGETHAMIATIHPSAILRAPDDDARHEEMRKFIADLKVAADYIRKNVRRAA